MGISVSAGQIIAASHYQSIKNQADAQYNKISSAPYRGTKPSGSNDAYRPNYSYNFAALRVSVGEIIYAYKLNNLSAQIDKQARQDCACDCNYCTCNCNYCGCNCAESACSCNYCACDCAWCSCNCNHSCTCQCNYHEERKYA